MEGLGILAEGEHFAVDVTLVQKVVRNIEYTPLPAAPGAVAGIANIKGGIVTLLSLSELLGRGRNANAAHAVVFKPMTNGNDQMGLLIDKPDKLISIIESDIVAPNKSEDDEGIFFISGLAEIGERLYKIINIGLLLNYK